MANKTITALTDIAVLTGTERVPVMQGGVTGDTTTQAIADLASGLVGATNAVETFLGVTAGSGNIGTSIVAIGEFVSTNNSGDAYIVAIGSTVGIGNTGSDIIAIGDNVANQNTGDFVVLIGSDISPLGNAFNNVVALGKSATPLIANSVTLGGADTITIRVGAPVAVVALPSDTDAGAGARAFVTDSNATLAAGLGNTVAAGGANFVPVFSDGTNWKIG